MSTDHDTTRSDWYGTRAGRTLYWGLIVATLLAVGVSTAGFPAFLEAILPVSLPDVETTIPPYVYLFGFLGATVYAFTTFARRFDEHGRYRLKVFSRTVAAFPLVAGVYLLAFAFLGFGTEAGGDPANGVDTVARERVIAGLVFLAGLYVSTTLLALETVANRLLGVDRDPVDRVRDRESTENANGRIVDGEAGDEEKVSGEGESIEEVADTGDIGADERETGEDDADDTDDPPESAR
ncbi:MAG: hypothetical protein PPP55_09840 [Halorubrum sp.]